MQGGKIEKEQRGRSIILDKSALHFSEVSVKTLEEKIKNQQKTIDKLNDDLCKICQLERKRRSPVFRCPGYEELHSLVTEIITRRGYKIKGRSQ